MSGAVGGAAFWVDREYDRDHSSDGASRFGAYVRRSPLVASCWGQEYEGDSDQVRAEWFAVAAWETATPPVMAPGYVRRHPMIRSARLGRQQDGAALSGIVDLSAPWPTALARSRDWRGGESWEGWPADSLGGWYYDPADDGMIAGRHLLLTTSRLEFPLSADVWAVPSGPGEAAQLAHKVIAELVKAMNAVVTPVISALGRA